MTKRNSIPAMHLRCRNYLHALNVLREKGVDSFLNREVVAEIEQRRTVSEGNPANYVKCVQALQREGVVQCINPEQRRYRRWKVINWRKLEVFLDQLNSTDGQELIAARTLGLASAAERLPEGEGTGCELIDMTTDEFEIQHTNGRKTVGWFKRWFTNAELVEELRETNRRLETLLEIWS